MRRTLTCVLLAVLAVAGQPSKVGSRLDAPVPDNKEMHWAYDGINRMRKEGLIILHTGIYMGPMTFTHRQFATWSYAWPDDLRAFVELNRGSSLRKQFADLDAAVSRLDGGTLVAGPVTADSAERVNAELVAYRNDVLLLHRFSRTLAPEMTEMGLNPKTVEQKLAEIDRLVAGPRPKDTDRESNE